MCGVKRYESLHKGPLRQLPEAVLQQLNSTGFLGPGDMGDATCQGVFKEAILVVNNLLIHHLAYGLAVLAATLIVFNNYDLLLLGLQVVWKSFRACLGYASGDYVLVIKRNHRHEWRRPVVSDALSGGVMLKEAKKVTFQTYCDCGQGFEPPQDNKGSSTSSQEGSGGSDMAAERESEDAHPLDVVGDQQGAGVDFSIEDEVRKLTSDQETAEPGEEDALLGDEPVYADIGPKDRQQVGARQVTAQVHQPEAVEQAQRLQHPLQEHNPEETLGINIRITAPTPPPGSSESEEPTVDIQHPQSGTARFKFGKRLGR